MTKLVIIGSGRHAKVIFSEAIKDNKYNIVGFVDSSLSAGEKIISFDNKHYYNLGNQEDTFKKIDNDFKAIIAVGLNCNRRKIYNDIKKINKDLQFESVVSKDAIINPLISLLSTGLIFL